MSQHQEAYLMAEDPPSRSHAKPSLPPPALDEIYRLHRSFVRAILHTFGVPERDLEDVQHDVFLVVQRKLSSFDVTRPMRPWLRGIARRCASDYHRRAYQRRVIMDNERVDRWSGGGSAPPPQIISLDRARTRRSLTEAIAALPDRQREIFILHEIEGIAMREIVAELGCPLQTGYSRLHAARKSVRSAIRRRHGKSWLGHLAAIFSPTAWVARAKAAAASMTGGFSSTSAVATSAVVVCAAGVVAIPTSIEPTSSTVTSVPIAAPANEEATTAPAPDALAKVNPASMITLQKADLGTRAKAEAVVRPSRRAPASTATLVEEARLLQRARNELIRDPNATLRLVASHRAQHPSSVLGQERDALAIEALAATGRMAEARAQWTQFQRRHPQSTHRPRLESLVAGNRAESPQKR